jgi:colanic acid/amylovoran biosynthesis glycosyltransferase
MKTTPLRLLFVSTAFPRTSETFVTDQVIGLHRLGHHVDVFTTGPGSLDDPSLQDKLSQAVGHLLLPPGTPAKPELAWLSQRRMPNFLHPRTWANLVRVGTTPHFYSLRYPLKRGAALLDRPVYDAVVCHFGPAGCMMQQMRDIGLIRAPLVTIFHGYDITNYLERVPADFYDDLFARGDLFLPISDRWRRRLKELGCPVDRTQLQRLGTNLDTFVHDYRLPDPGAPLRLMSVARLVEKKGIEFAIRAVALLKAEGVPVSYDIIGDGPLRGELENLVRKLGLEDMVTFLGARSHDEVASIMRDHHILMVPSVTDAQGGMEGIPVAIMEAMAAGLLVVGSVHSGIPEIVHHGENGLLAAERDEEGLARELARIAADLPEWRRLVGAARDTVHQEYNLKTQNQRLADILAGLTP